MHQIPHTQSYNSSPNPRTNKALELLYGGVSKLMESESWKRALAQRQVFHNYSFRNCWLIYLQRPDATLVAGYRKWHELGRQVKGGVRRASPS
jgi:hypothetical protein